MSPPTAEFDVGGTVFKVAVSTIKSQPDGLLAKMISGRCKQGKDKSGAYFIDRNPVFFSIVLDVHRDNKVYPLPPGMTRERVVAELEFYGLQDFDVPIDRSVESMLRGHHVLSFEFSEWQKQHETLGTDLLTEGFAHLMLAQAEIPKEQGSRVLGLMPVKLEGLQLTRFGMVYPSDATNMHIVKFFEDWGAKETFDNINAYHPKINLELDEPGAGA